MDPVIAKQLEQAELTPFHQKMLAHCKLLLSMSRNAMQERYCIWDKHDDVYQGIRRPDEDDKQASEKGEPIKMVVPLMKSQVQTAVGFCMALFLQRPEVYEMEGTGVEDWKSAKISSGLLQRDMEMNQHYLKLNQFLVDIFKFGIGILKTSWVKESQRVPNVETTPSVMVGPFTLFSAKTKTTYVEQTKYLGNRINNISPYRFFPDPRLPISRFQEGEFCGSEDEVTRTQLMRMQHDGVYAGVSHISDWSKTLWDKRGGASGSSRLPNSGFVDMTAGAAVKGGQSSGRAVCVSEMQVSLIPSEFEVENGVMLGEEDYPVKYVVVIANDNRVIKCEPLGYLHDEYTYDVSQYDPDQHHFLNGGLADTIDELQSIITWLINSHITAVRKTIQNTLLVDPDFVNMEDLKERRPVVRMRKGAAMSGIDRYVKQLEIRDVTQNNIRDAGSLGEIVQTVTGVSENAQGTYSKGRRSAEQTRAVNSGAATRLRIVAMLIWSTGLLPMGRKMLSNLRDGLDEATFVKVMGLQTEQPLDPNAVSAQDFNQRFKVSKEDLVGNYDFVALDGTLPSEKAQNAQILQDLLTGMMSNPEVAAIFGFDPRALLQEILELRGIRNPERFKVKPTLPPGGLAQAQAQQQIAAQVEQQQQPSGGGEAVSSPGSAAGMTPQMMQQLIAQATQQGQGGQPQEMAA